MKTIAILNAYGKTNIGDAAILNKSLDLLSNVIKNDTNIHIHCEDQNSLDIPRVNKMNFTLKQNPYGYAIKSEFSRAHSVTKIARFMMIFIFSYLILYLSKYQIITLPTKGFFSYIYSIKQSDLVISMGGGYLTTKYAIKDYFGLLLTLLPIYVAKFHNKKILILPISFGPFATDTHKNLTYNALKNTTVFVRDDISFRTLATLNIKQEVELLPTIDLALAYQYNQNYSIHKKRKSKYIVLTAREWLNTSKQMTFENSLAEFIKEVWESHRIRTVFVPMAFNLKEDDDNRLANRLVKLVNNELVFNVSNAKTPKEVQDLMDKALLSICTRMHSAILSFTTNTPFISIGYGHKAEGLMKQLNLMQWYIDISSINQHNLLIKFETLLKKDNFYSFRNKISTSRKSINLKFINIEQRLSLYI